MIPQLGSNSPATARRAAVSRLLHTAQGSGIRLVALDELARDARVALRFFVNEDVVATPRIELPGLLAPLAVSTPEATALDLIGSSRGSAASNACSS
jgi:hypothetical protein